MKRKRIRSLSEHDKNFFSGVCACLQVIALYDEGTVWGEIVRTCGEDEFIYYATKVEPDEYDLCSVGQYAASELNRKVRRPKQ